MNQGQLDWGNIYSAALDTRDRIVSTDSFLVEEVTDALDRRTDIDIAFLNAVGLFDYPRLVNQEELVFILPRVSSRIDAFVPFCVGLVSAFPKSITEGGNIVCAAFLNIVNRSEFELIRQQMVQSVLVSFVRNPKSIPSVRHKIGSSWMSSVLTCTGGKPIFSGPFTFGQELLQAISACMAEPQGYPETQDLARQLEELREIKKSQPKTLFNIRFSDGAVDLIRRGVFYSSVSREYPNRCRVEESFENAGISRSEMMLLSMFCFAQTQEKEENRNFWPQFQSWFGFTEQTCKLNSLRNACIKAFEGIQTIRTDSSTQYVQTSLMHSIISNRPMSKQNAYRLFCRLFRRNGYVGHSRDDIELLVADLMESGSLSIPSETRNAYSYNPDQTVAFLVDQYGYYETGMLNLLGYDPVLEITPARFAITDHIDQMIASVKQDEQQTGKLRASAAENRIKAGRFHSPYVSVEENGFENWIVSISCGYYNLEDEDLKGLSEASVHVDGKPVASLEIADGEIIGERIPLQREWRGKRISIVAGGEELDSAVIPENLLFDFSTHRTVSRRMMRNCHHYLLVADPLEFSFDDAIYAGESSIQGLNVYDITLDEDNFILLNGGIVGISQDDASARDFLDSIGIAADVNVLTPDGIRIPIRGDWPKINLITNKDDDVLVSANGHSMDYAEDYRCELRDGSGRLFRRLLVYEMFPNVKTIDFSVIVGGTRKLSERFYALRNFSYDLDRIVYEPGDKVTVTEMSFDDMKAAFGQKHYQFPGQYETLKFKLADGNAIVMDPPVFRFSVSDGSPIRETMSATEFGGKALLSGCTPKLEKNLRICVENADGNCGWLRKAKGSLWDCSAVMESNRGRSGKFNLVCYALGTRHEICDLYFVPTASDQSIRFHSNRHMRIGRDDGIYYHCRLLGMTDPSRLKIRISSQEGKIADEFTPDSTDIYRRLPDDFPAGRYNVAISEQRRSLRVNIVDRTYEQPEVVFDGRPINGDLIISVTSAVVAGERTPRNVQRSGIVFKGQIRKKPIKGDTIVMNGSFHISNQYSERDIDFRVNPCMATVSHIDGNIIGISVVGKDKRPLGIDGRDFINPEYPHGRPSDIKFLYGTFEIKEFRR